MIAQGNVNKQLFPQNSVGLRNKQVLGFITIFQIISFFILGFNFYYQLAIFIFISQAVLLFFNVGKNIPVRYLIGTMYSLNYLLVPVIMFNGLNENTQGPYRVVGSPDLYFSYVIPAILMLILGLHLFKRKEDTILDIKKITSIAVASPRLPYYLIVIGLISGFISTYVPSELSLIFVVIGYFKFAGFFLSLFNQKPINYFYLFLTYGLLVITSLTSSLFNDLLNMLFFLAFILALRYKAGNSIKLLGLISIVGLVMFIQVIKFPLRERVSGSIGDLGKINEAVDVASKDGEDKSFNDKIAEVLVRLDQGWVTSKSMEYYYTGNYVLQNGNHCLILIESALFPRLLVPNKLTVGDPQEFNKYSGHTVREGTSIALGLVTDGFIDFGFAGIFIVFLFGVIVSTFISLYHKLEREYPLMLLFLPVGFFYVVRADNDTQASLGALLKMTFVIWLSMQYIKKNPRLFIAKKVK